MIKPPSVPSAMTAAGWKIFSGLSVVLVSALLALLLRSSGNEQRIANIEAQQTKQDLRIERIETSLANGGPPVLANRVDALQVDFNDMKQQVRDIWQVTVRGQPVPRR